MVQEIKFPPHKSWDPFSPTGTLPPDGSAYRDVDNIRLGDPFLRRRAQVKTGGGEVQNLAQEATTVEYPVHFWTEPDEDYTICITNQRVLIAQFIDGVTLGYTDISPVIDEAAGPATATSGSDQVTGVTATANKYPFKPGDIVEVDGETIGTVTAYAGTTITLDNDALISATGQWKVRKSININPSSAFGLNPGGRSHFRVFNGDLYVGARWEVEITGSSIDEIQHKWGVYYWQNLSRFIFEKEFDATVWLVANEQFDGTLATAQVRNSVTGNEPGEPNNLIDHDSANVRIPGQAHLAEVVGLDLLQDGRVIVPVATEIASARVYYSSPIEQPQIHWNEAPGGFSDNVTVPGRLQVMGRLGNTLTFHWQGGIGIGTPTGQLDPPLAFSATREQQGCTYWRTLVNVNAALEAFLGPDAVLYGFNGSSVQIFGRHPKTALGANISRVPQEVFASWDGYNRELSVWHFRITQDTQSESRTSRVVLGLDTQAWTKDSWNFFVTACGRDLGDIDTTGTGSINRSAYAFVGVPAFRLFGNTGEDYQDMVQLLGETTAVEYQPPWVDDPVPPTFVEISNFHGEAQQVSVAYVGMEMAKRISGVEDEEITVDVTYERDGSNPSPNTIVLNGVFTGRSKVFYFEEFGENSGEKMRVKFQMGGSPVSGAFRHGIGILRIGLEILGDNRSEGSPVG